MQRNNEEKEKAKRLKQLIKQLKVHFQERYAEVVKYLYETKEPNAFDKVKTLIKEEPNFYVTMNIIENMRNGLKQEQEFFEKVKYKDIDAHTYMQDIKSKIVLVTERIDKVKSRQVLTPKQIKYRNHELNMLEKRLDELLYTEKMLDKTITNILEEQKQPRGRPKKDTEKDRIEEILEYKENENYEEQE